MTYEQALKIIGRTNLQKPYFNNMIKALQMHQHLNTPEEQERLAACHVILNQIKKEKTS